MKKIFTNCLFFFALAIAGFGQTVPQGIPYQAVLRNTYGIPMGDRDLDVRVRILDPLNDHLYLEEEHHVTVAPEGTFGLVIGEGRALNGDFRSIPWSVGRMWVDILYDLRGNGQFESSGAMQLLSVPYALYAQTAGRALNGDAGADTRADGSEVVEKYWKTNGNDLLPPDTTPFLPDSIIANQDIIPQWLGTRTMKPLLIRTSDSLRMFLMPNGDLYVLKDQYNYGNLDVKGNGRFQGDLIVKGMLDATSGAFWDLQVYHNLWVDNSVHIGNNLDVDMDTNLDGDLTVHGISRFLNSTQSNTKDDGAVILEGGIGIEKNANIGGNTEIDGTLGVDGITTLKNTTQSTTKDNGALVVEGGVGIEKNLNVGGDFTLSGILNVTNTTESTATNNGALVVAGGVGIGKRLNVGGVTRIWNSTESSATTNGAFIVDGGIGIAKKAFIGGNLRVENMASTYLTGSLTVDKATDLNSTLNVDGTTTLNNTTNVYGQLTIQKALGVDQEMYTNYPLRVEGSYQGVAIKLESLGLPGKPNANNNYITFFGPGTDNARGRVEGSTGISDLFLTLFDDFLVEQPDSVASDENNEPSDLPAANIPSAFTDWLGSNYGFDALNLAFDFAFTIVQFVINASAAGWTFCLGGDCDDAVWSLIDMIKTGIQFGVLIAVEETNLGVTYESGGADYAEWLPLADTLETFVYGDIVGIQGGRLSKHFATPEKYMVLSENPGVLGAMPEPGQSRNYRKVAFMGQVPVRVFGPVHVGDYILPSGEEDGVGIAVSPDAMQTADFRRIVGVAWADSEEGKAVNIIKTAVGMHANQLVGQVEKLQALINRMQESLARLDPGYEPIYFPGDQQTPALAGITRVDAAYSGGGMISRYQAGELRNMKEILLAGRDYAETMGMDLSKFPMLEDLFNDPSPENALRVLDHYNKVLDKLGGYMEQSRVARKG